NAAPQHHPRLERVILDTQSHDLVRRTAYRLHRFLFEPRRPVLGKALRRLDHGDCTHIGDRLVRPEATCPWPHLRSCKIMGTIVLKDVQKSFGDVTIIPNANLAIENGEFVVFVGPSGCGKSTLLRLIAGLEDVTGGDIVIDGTNAAQLPPAKRGLSMVFQSYALYPHMSVRNNIAFGLKMAGH